ncbi:uncharacterized protein [Symphalangus syndactylus]|uniref:uncharacterized protein isoform X2 n=1 Tax=Symphalangus syndactylus TaxID=9590 RepID=UPI0030067495
MASPFMVPGAQAGSGCAPCCGGSQGHPAALGRPDTLLHERGRQDPFCPATLGHEGAHSPGGPRQPLLLRTRADFFSRDWCQRRSAAKELPLWQPRPSPARAATSSGRPSSSLPKLRRLRQRRTARRGEGQSARGPPTWLSPRPAAEILHTGRAAEAEGWGGRPGSGRGSQRRSFCLLFPSPRFGKVFLLGKPLSSACWRVSDWLAATGPRRPQQDSPLSHRSSGSCQTPVVAASGWGLY